jgi:hypothetical protein
MMAGMPCESPSGSTRWFSTFLGTNEIALRIYGFDPTKPAPNLAAWRDFATTDDLRNEIIEARVWEGLRYRFSGIADVAQGHSVAADDLRHAFQPAHQHTNGTAVEPTTDYAPRRMLRERRTPLRSRRRTVDGLSDREMPPRPRISLTTSFVAQ